MNRFKSSLLIVEDNEENRDILTNMLRDEYEIMTASNGQEALEILANHYGEITVILLDIYMPIMSGYEFMERINQDSRFHDIPVIVTTSHNTVEEELKCLKLGVFDFIGKPYNVQLIRTRVRNISRLRQVELSIASTSIDSLTGFKTRKSYYDDIIKFESHPVISQKPCGILFVDINELKRCNDEDGHEAGDRLIVNIAEKVRRYFMDAEIYRLGGDEFVVFSFLSSEDDFKKRIDYLKDSWTPTASASLGYVWLGRTQHLEQMVAIADKNMYVDKSRFYEKKLYSYRSGTKINSDDVLKIVNEVSECLPGGFFTYQANEQEKLINFNSEVVRMYGCSSPEEFREHVGNSFRGMVHPEDWIAVQQDIDDQIKRIRDLDFVKYRIVRKDGTVRTVRDYGRFVHSELYGNMYYVFLAFD